MLITACPFDFFPAKKVKVNRSRPDASPAQQDTILQSPQAVIIPRPPEKRKEWRADSTEAFELLPLEPGLHLAIAEAPTHTNIGDNRLYILRVDPAYFDFEIISAKTENEQPKKASDWVEKHDLIAAINAGMYQMDHLTNVGFMKDHNRFNNSKFTKDNSIVVFHPNTDSLPPFAILDRSCDDWDSMLPQYQSATQGLRDGAL